MRVHHLSCGTMCPVAGRLLFYRATEPMLQRLVCHCLLIETDRHGLVLVDTGLGLRDVHHAAARLSKFFRAMNGIQLREEETALQQIKARGYQASDVRHIVLTHLDFDHAGGIEDFPAARVHVSNLELHAAKARRGPIARGRYRPAQWNTGVQWQTYHPHGETWFGFRSIRQLKGLPPEILMVPLVGHTIGHCGIAIRRANGWLLHAGDAYFDADEMDPRGYACTLGLRLYQRMMEVDRRARLANQARLRKLVADHGAEVSIFCAHDAAELHRFVAPQLATTRVLAAGAE